MVEVLAGIGHQFMHRIDRALRRHHGGGADLEDLNDVRLLLSTERGDRGRHGLRIIALVNGDHLVITLRSVEIAGNLLDLLSQRAAHGMPPLDLGLGKACLRRDQKCSGCRQRQ